MRNIRLLLEYDGSAYHGWQCQKNGASVQETLADAIAAITGERVMPEGAGRTDAGVHALGQVACFRTESRIPSERFADALNAVLPRNIAVTASEEADMGFHPRKHATGKLYRYTVLNRPYRSALMEGRAWHVPAELDLAAMRRAAAEVAGTHDFRSFCASGHSVKTYVRTIRRAEWTGVPGEGVLQFDIEGSGFLYNMVRILVGTMVEIGRGKRPVDDLRMLLEAGDRRKAGITAPAGGLCMMAVRYGPGASTGNGRDEPERHGQGAPATDRADETGGCGMPDGDDEGEDEA